VEISRTERNTWIVFTVVVGGVSRGSGTTESGHVVDHSVHIDATRFILDNVLMVAVLQLPYTNSIAASCHVDKSCLITGSGNDEVAYGLVPFPPWSRTDYQVFISWRDLRSSS
jgi:hypothetical protein